ncbi:MAG: type IV pilin [Thermoplasmatota archaeon]
MALHRPQSHHPATGSETAVSDILGTIILIAITVVMAGAMATLVLAYPAPSDTPHPNLAVSVNPGQGGWNTGDESIQVSHIGGDAITASDVAIAWSVNGGPTTTLKGSNLGPPFSTSANFHIGQTWTHVMTLASTDSVAVSVVTHLPSSALQVSAVLVPGQIQAGSSCPFDTQAPTATYTQTPANLTVATQGSVGVVAALADNCAGVDSSVAPHLFWRLTPAQATFTDQGAMAPLGNFRWSGNVPAPASTPVYWALQYGQTLQYYVSPVTDLKANTGAAATQSNAVQIGGTMSYVTAHTEVSPTTITNPGNLQAADGQWAVINEGLGPATTTLVANSVAATGTGWAGGTSTYAQDGVYATNANTAPGALQLGFTSPAAGGTIASVKVSLVQDISPAAVDDTWSVHACLAGGSCGTTTIAAQSGTTTDTTLTFDLTGDRPGGGAWTWTDMTKLQVSIQPNKVAARDGTWRLDYATVAIVANGYTGTETLDWTGVPAGTSATHYLDMSYSGAAAENWNVKVWNWVTSAYTQRAVFANAGATQFTYVLAANEYQVGTGNIRIQLTDLTPTDTTGPNSLSLDYARVDTI